MDWDVMQCVAKQKFIWIVCQLCFISYEKDHFFSRFVSFSARYFEGVICCGRKNHPRNQVSVFSERNKELAKKIGEKYWFKWFWETPIRIANAKYMEFIELGFDREFMEMLLMYQMKFALLLCHKNKLRWERNDCGTASRIEILPTFSLFLSLSLSFSLSLFLYFVCSNYILFGGCGHFSESNHVFFSSFVRITCQHSLLKYNKMSVMCIARNFGILQWMLDETQSLNTYSQWSLGTV